MASSPFSRRFVLLVPLFLKPIFLRLLLECRVRPGETSSLRFGYSHHATENTYRFCTQPSRQKSERQGRGKVNTNGSLQSCVQTTRDTFYCSLYSTYLYAIQRWCLQADTLGTIVSIFYLKNVWKCAHKNPSRPIFFAEQIFAHPTTRVRGPPYDQNYRHHVHGNSQP